MQRSISVHRLYTFRHLLTDGATNEISRFDVISSNVEFKLSDSNVSIHFTNYNKFVESTESGASIRQENMFFVPNFGVYLCVVKVSEIFVYVDEDIMATLHDRCVSKFQLRITERERVTEDRVFERYQKNTISAEGIVPHESYILRQVHKVSGGRYHAEKPLKIQISATLKQQLIVWENITHQDKVQPGSAADGSSQANDIDGKKKIKRARSCY
ncbi:unnamed protein product [Brassica oleracea]